MAILFWVPKFVKNSKLTSNPSSLQMLRRQQQPTRRRWKERRVRDTSRCASDGTGWGEREPQEEAGPRRKPPPRTRSYPPIGRGAQSFSQSSKPLYVPRPRSAKLSQWAAALQAPGSRSLGSSRVSVAGQSGSQVVAGHGTSVAWCTSDRSLPAACPGWGRRTAAELGPPGAWALVAAEVDGWRPFVKSTNSQLPLRVRPPGRLHHHGAEDSFQMWTPWPTLPNRKSRGEP